MLFCHGDDDPFVDCRTSLAAVEAMPSGDVTIRVHKGARRKLVNETNRDEAIDKVARFVARVADCGSFARAQHSSGRAADIVDAATVGARSGVGDAAVFEHRRPKGLAGPMQANGCVVLSDVEPNRRLAEFKTVRVHETQDRGVRRGEAAGLDHAAVTRVVRHGRNDVGQLALIVDMTQLDLPLSIGVDDQIAMDSVDPRHDPVRLFEGLGSLDRPKRRELQNVVGLLCGYAGAHKCTELVAV